MGWMDKLRDKVVDWLAIDGRWSETEARNRLTSMALNSDYYFGFHRRPFRVRVNQPDDNIAINYTKLLVNKSTALLLGKGVEFDLPGEGDTPQDEYLEQVWAANKKDILLQNAAQYGGIHGTVFLKLIPEALETPDGKFIPRLVVLNPLHWEIETEEEDIDAVIRYVGRFTISGPDGKDTARRSVVERELAPDGDVVRWWVNDYWFVQGTWKPMHEPIAWDYIFPPILHWKNLPNAGEVYGLPDIDDNTIEIQDRINFVASNISKVIRYHAHPKTWGKNLGTRSDQSWGADQLISFSGDAHLENLEMTSDLASSINYLGMLRQAFFDTTQTVDLATVKDKIGALTNFGLRVIYLDAESKINQKREVWGEALVELNHRLLVIGGITPDDGGVVIWADVLPVNETETMTADKFELDYKIASKQSISERRGYDWDDEQERMTAEEAAGDNVGAAILRAFSGGQ